MMERLYIVNPIAGKGGRKKKIVDRLIKSGKNVVFTKYPGNAVELAHDSDCPVTVAVGGDGTVNEVARGLAGTGRKMGIIPCGSGNGLARHLKLFRNFSRCEDILEKGHTQPLDSGTINGKPFYSVCGVGLDATVSKRFQESGKRGLSTYIKEAARTWRDFHPETYRISLDGKEFTQEAVLITIGNSNQWGNGAKVTPLARTDDGELDLTVISMFRTVEIPVLALRLMTGSLHKSGRVKCYRAKHIEIDRSAPGPAHCDGDYIEAGTHISVSVIPHSLEIIVP